jgi:hypothetical protein
MRFRKSHPTIKDERKIIPGDHVEMPDKFEDFFNQDELVKSQPIPQPVKPQKEAVKKPELKKENELPKKKDPLALDLPEVREKVKEKFEDRKKKKSLKKRKSLKGRKKCKKCKKFNCICEKE